MSLNFTGTPVVPKRGANLAGRKTTGVRTSLLKKGQKVITLGEDVLKDMNLTDLGDGLKVKVVSGNGAVWAGKLMIQPDPDGPLTLRYVSKDKKTAAHIMSASLPFEHAAKAKFKVYGEDKAVVLVVPTESDATGKKEATSDATDAEKSEGTEGDAAATTGDAAAAGDAAAVAGEAPAADADFSA